MNVTAEITVLCAYGLATLVYGLYLLTERRLFLLAGRGIIGTGFAVHTLAWLQLNHARGQWGVIGTAESYWFFAWLLVLALFIVGSRLKIAILGCLLPPLAFLFGIAGMSAASHRIGEESLKSHWLPLHVFGAFMGEALFAVTAVIGVLYLVQEHQLKTRKLGFLSSRLPPLESMDRIIDRVLKWGFLFLTLGILTGAMWAQSAMRSQWTFDPKQISALVTWGIYALMIFLRAQHRINGRKGAMIAVLASVTVFFTLLGTNLIYGDPHAFWKL